MTKKINDMTDSGENSKLDYKSVIRNNVSKGSDSYKELDSEKKEESQLDASLKSEDMRIKNRVKYYQIFGKPYGTGYPEEKKC